MGFFELFLIGIGLSMDAFAVAICKGLGMERINKRDTLLLALFFGGFQALMPLTGYLLGSRFASYIERWDHWIAFVLLAFIGSSMIRESREQEEEEIEHGGSIRYRELFTLAVATSIDALAVGSASPAASGSPATASTAGKATGLSYEQRKELERQKNRRAKRLAQCEEQIAQKEQRLKELEDELCNITDLPRIQSLTTEYEKLKFELDSLMNEWEKLAE